MVHSPSKKRFFQRLQVACPLVWFLFFLVIPLCFVFIMALYRQTSYGGFKQEWTFVHLVRLADPLYLRIYGVSIKFAAMNALVCLFVGFPLAYAMAMARPKMRMLLQMLVMLPFLTNFIIRTEATRIFLSVDGPMSHLLMAIHQTAVPVTFLNTQGAVWFGMVTNYLPMMVFPLFVALDSLDYDLIQAAYELGANKIQAFFYVLLPLIRGGIMTGFTLVFVPSLGEFIIPQILGGGRLMLLGGLITEQFLKYRNWPFGAALSALLAIIALVGIYLLGRVVDLQGEGKMG